MGNDKKGLGTQGLGLTLGGGIDPKDVPSPTNLSPTQETIILIIGTSSKPKDEFALDTTIINEQHILRGLKQSGLGANLEIAGIRKILDNLDNLRLVETKPISLNTPGIHLNNKYSLTTLGLETYDQIKPQSPKLPTSTAMNPQPNP